MSETTPWLREQFETAGQQREAAHLGMWGFIATEIMFFGGLFAGYTVYRYAYPHAFAEGSRHTNLLYGTINTALLLTSSLTMTLAVNAAQRGLNRAIVWNILLTVLLAAGFLAVKGLEYSEDIREHLVPGPSFFALGHPHEELFFYFYWAMTGLHALHLLIGIGVLSGLALMAARHRYSEKYFTPIEMGGLYWHFVDTVWIFLYPLLYLIDRHI